MCFNDVVYYNTSMDNTQNQTVLICPECDSPLIIPENIVIGKIIECSACGSENEVISDNPIKLAPLEEEK